ncbi:MAG: hypothetical protein JW910_05200, partial [Anaerolineae bacterium]|nr:hypothetical protein [Anaerolineae bacterium]
MIIKTRKTRGLAFALVALLLLALVPRALAHPADMFFHQHDLALTPEGLTDTWTLAPGPLLAFTVWEQADTDRDGAVSETEARAWAEAGAPEIVLLWNDETALPWQVEAV